MEKLYLEIIEFLHSCGGTYSQYHRDTGRNVARALHEGRYAIIRDDSGIVGFGCYEKRGDEIVILECGGKGLLRDMRRYLRQMEPDFKGLRYDHRVLGNARFFPSQRGKA